MGRKFQTPSIYDDLTVFENLEISFPRGRSVFGALTFKRDAEVRDRTRRALPTMRDLDEAMEQVAAGVGILIVPHSIARLHSRKDVVSRPVEDVAECQVSLAWLTSETTEDVEEFIGIVRGRTKDSSRIDSLPAERVKKEKKTDKAKAAAKAVRVAAAKAKPAPSRKTPTAPGRTRPTASPKKGKRRGSR